MGSSYIFRLGNDQHRRRWTEFFSLSHVQIQCQGNPLNGPRTLTSGTKQTSTRTWHSLFVGLWCFMGDWAIVRERDVSYIVVKGTWVLWLNELCEEKDWKDSPQWICRKVLCTKKTESRRLKWHMRIVTYTGKKPLDLKSVIEHFISYYSYKISNIRSKTCFPNSDRKLNSGWVCKANSTKLGYGGD